MAFFIHCFSLSRRFVFFFLVNRRRVLLHIFLYGRCGAFIVPVFFGINIAVSVVDSFTRLQANGFIRNERSPVVHHDPVGDLCGSPCWSSSWRTSYIYSPSGTVSLSTRAQVNSIGCPRTVTSSNFSVMAFTLIALHLAPLMCRECPAIHLADVITEPAGNPNNVCSRCCTVVEFFFEPVLLRFRTLSLYTR